VSGLAPPGIAAAAPITPATHGLTSVMLPLVMLDGTRWQAGYQVYPEACIDFSWFESDCSLWTGDPAGPADKDPAADNAEVYEVDPVLPYTQFECNSAGWSSQDYQGRARRAIEAASSKALEYELWTGAMNSDNPHLITGATVLNGGEAVPAANGPGVLGQGLASCGGGGRGVLHAPPVVADLWWQMGALKEDGNRLVTVARGDLVVVGSGYPGTGPGGSAPDENHSWVYATGMVTGTMEDIQINPPTFREAFHRTTNRIRFLAERLMTATFDPCCHFALYLDLCTDCDAEVS
jgi:hypothetical protein